MGGENGGGGRRLEKRASMHYSSFDRFLISVVVSIISILAAWTFVAPKAVIIIIISGGAVEDY